MAFSIFRSQYNKGEKIHQLSGDTDKNIRLGYTGGSTDMYIPLPPKNKKIYAYSCGVNSLYPFVMNSFKYPIGDPTYFEGDILKTEPYAFGFFYCKIITPPFLDHPILQLHHNNRTISPLGTFEGWFFSEELYNAKKYGYNFEVIRGYLFESDYVFKDYVKDLYNIRTSYPKSDPMNYTAKLLLNSLYGRFGMNDNFPDTFVLTKEEYLEIESNPDLEITTMVPLIVKNKEKYLIQFNNPTNYLKTRIDGSLRETH